jgi:predicted hydrocarbon binding protein
MSGAVTGNGSYFYPNRMGRIILHSMRQQLGAEQVLNVLRAAGHERLLSTMPLGNFEKRFPFETVSALQRAAEEVFGVRAGRQINHRIGRGTLELGLKDFDPLLGIADLPMRLMPLGMKFRVGLDVFARVFNQFSDQVVKLSETEQHHLWIIERCPVCWGRQTDEVCCHLAGGLLEEAIFWGTGGRRFRVEEVSCIAMGGASCTFQIDKRPLD